MMEQEPERLWCCHCCRGVPTAFCTAAELNALKLVGKARYILEHLSVMEAGEVDRCMSRVHALATEAASLLRETVCEDALSFGEVNDLLAQAYAERRDWSRAVEHAHKSLCITRLAFGEDSVEAVREEVKWAMLLCRSTSGQGNTLLQLQEVMQRASMLLGSEHDDVQAMRCLYEHTCVQHSFKD